MSFISNRTKAHFYNDSHMTFFVQKDCVDIIFKIKRGVYLTVSVYSLSEGWLLLTCDWDKFWNRLKGMRNRKDVLAKLKKECPLAVKIFTNSFETLDESTSLPYFAYIDKEQMKGAVVLKIKAPINTNSISDYLHEKVVIKAMELMEYNLNLYCELKDNCPFPVWKDDLSAL